MPGDLGWSSPLLATRWSREGPRGLFVAVSAGLVLSLLCGKANEGPGCGEQDGSQDQSAPYTSELGIMWDTKTAASCFSGETRAQRNTMSQVIKSPGLPFKGDPNLSSPSLMNSVYWAAANFTFCVLQRNQDVDRWQRNPDITCSAGCASEKPDRAIEPHVRDMFPAQVKGFSGIRRS